MTIPTMVTISEAAAQTGLSYNYLRNLCLQNKIIHVRAGRKRLINLGKLIEFLNQGDGENEEI